MSRDRSRPVLAVAAVVMIASALVAQTAAGADTATTSTSTSTSTTTTSAPTSTTSSSTTSSTTSTTAATSTTNTPPTSATPGTDVPTTLATSQAPPPVITPLASAVPVFIVAGTSSKAPAGTAIEITQILDVTYYVDDPSPELSSALQNFYQQGGGDAYLWLTSDEQADTLLAAATQIAQTDTPATLFVIPALSTLEGQEYLDVATAVAALADAKLGLALLDSPATAVAAVRAAWPDVSALADVAEQLRTSVATKGLTAMNSAAFYATPLIDPSSGDTVSAAAVMAGIITREDSMNGPWVAPAGTGVPVFDLDVLLPITNVQQEELGPDVNPFRSFPHYGTVMWGARTLDFNSQEYRYIQVDRTLGWIQRSISAGLQWTVFEPNNPATQSLIEQTVTAYLTTLWRTGALQGDQAADAFQVSPGGTTPFENQPTAAPGVLTVGLSLVQPGEFVWIQIPVTTASG